jgi:hypothetical protein
LANGSGIGRAISVTSKSDLGSVTSTKVSVGAQVKISLYASGGKNV